MSCAAVISRDERAKLRRYFLSVLWVAQGIDVYWLPERRHILTRGVSGARGPQAIPRTAVYVGRYEYPCSSVDFLSDVQDLISRLPGDTPQADPHTQVRQPKGDG